MVYIFHKDINPKLNVRAQLKFEHCYNNVAVQHVSHSAARHPLQYYGDIFIQLRVHGKNETQGQYFSAEYSIFEFKVFFFLDWLLRGVNKKF